MTIEERDVREVSRGMESLSIRELGRLIDQGEITTNQAREALGLSKIDGGDQYLMLKKSCSEVHAGQQLFP